MIGPQQCFQQRNRPHEPHVWKRETDLGGGGEAVFCAGVDVLGQPGTYRVGQGGSGPNPSVPACPVCGAHGGGGHGGFCPNG